MTDLDCVWAAYLQGPAPSFGVHFLERLGQVQYASVTQTYFVAGVVGLRWNAFTAPKESRAAVAVLA